MIEREYAYQLKAGRVLTRAVLFGAAAVGFAFMAMTNDRGLILYVIPLSKNGATIFYGAFAGLAAVISTCDAVNVNRRAMLRQRIAFTEDGLMVPRSSWSSEEELIPYDSIVKLDEFTEPDSLVLIQHRGGVFTLRLDLLPDERAYAEILHNLARGLREAKARAGDPPSKARDPELA